MKYIFIADFFENEVNGGAELTDSKLRKLIAKNNSIETIKCINVTINWLKSHQNSRFIISNFVMLDESIKKYLIENCNYVIWEHDHKYLKSRNPSIFKDFLAPKDQLQNVDFYKSAKAVVCQTNLHAKVVKQNLNINNIVNFGGSIWNDEELNFIENQIKDKKNNNACFAQSDNPYKGSKESEVWCKQQVQDNFKYTSIQPCEWSSFIKQLSEHNIFVFFPQVLETCSRVCVEARMLGLKIVGNKNIAALQEEWFKLKGKDLIAYFTEKNKTIETFVDNCFNLKQKTFGEITVILNLWKRPQNLQKQIDAFKNQTIKPKEIWIWQNYALEGQTPEEYIEASQQSIKWITSNHNWGVFGRFTMAQMVQTEFVCVNDDDTIPGPKWLETCLESFSTHPGLQGGIGVVLTSDDYKNHFRIGWAEPKSTTEEVDLVGHSWFFPKSYLQYMWREEPFTWRMEDAHFSYCLQKYGNIKTYVPPQDTKDKSSSILGYELGVDNVAMSNPINHNQFYNERDSAIKYYLNNGWKKVLK